MTPALLVIALPVFWLALEVRLLRLGRAPDDLIDRWFATMMRERTRLQERRRKELPRKDN